MAGVDRFSRPLDPILVCKVPDFAAIILTQDIHHGDTFYPKGTKGVVVHRHDDCHFEVELTDPIFNVLTLTLGDVEIVEWN